nr:hypothetical protein Iba_chr08eCG5460 [Ipomoea batatas]
MDLQSWMFVGSLRFLASQIKTPQISFSSCDRPKASNTQPHSRLIRLVRPSNRKPGSLGLPLYSSGPPTQKPQSLSLSLDPSGHPAESLELMGGLIPHSTCKFPQMMILASAMHFMTAPNPEFSLLLLQRWIPQIQKNMHASSTSTWGFFWRKASMMNLQACSIALKVAENSHISPPSPHQSPIS